MLTRIPTGNKRSIPLPGSCGRFGHRAGSDSDTLGHFRADCEDFSELSIVLRDIDVSPAGSPEYAYDAC